MNLRLNSSFVALLCCAIRVRPENANLVESIIFNKNVDLKRLLTNHNNKLKWVCEFELYWGDLSNDSSPLNRSRTCMLLRIIGRYSCVALQSAWTSDIRCALEALSNDKDSIVRDVSETQSSKIDSNYLSKKFFFSERRRSHKGAERTKLLC